MGRSVGPKLSKIIKKKTQRFTHLSGVFKADFGLINMFRSCITGRGYIMSVILNQANNDLNGEPQGSII